MKNEFPDSEVQANGTERHKECGGDILYFKEGWICSKCKESGPDEDEDEDELGLPGKMAIAIEAISIITMLIRPGNDTVQRINDLESQIRLLIAKAQTTPESEPEPFSQPAPCGHPDCSYACSRRR